MRGQQAPASPARALPNAVAELAPALDETEKRHPADPRLPDRREDAAALVIGRARGDLLCRSDEHLVAARDGLPFRAEPGSFSAG
jgi:hypothetical protein